MAARIALNDRTTSRIEVYITDLDSNYTKNDRTVAWYIDGELDGYDSLDGGIESSEVWKFRGLNSGTEYTIEAIIFNESQSIYVELSRDISTKEEAVEPEPDPEEPEPEEPDEPKEETIDNWYWGTSITSGTLLSSISYTKWNSLIAKIEELLNTGHYGSWLTKSSEGAVLSASQSRVSSSDKKLTADRFNSVRYNIGSHRGTGVGKVSQGDIVYASYFKGLETGINNWIDDYNNTYT